MKLTLLGATFLVGLLLALHLAMNAAVGKIVGNPRMGNAVFWLIGAGMAAPFVGAVVPVVVGLPPGGDALLSRHGRNHGLRHHVFVLLHPR